MRVWIRGQYWHLFFRRLRGQAIGWCIPYSRESRRRLLIHDQLSPKETLRILIHEMLHACDPTKDESWVDESSRDMAEILWDLGYRRE